jgi:hypothetical protein
MGKYADLSGVLTQCEGNEDTDSEWLADVRGQAVDFLRRYGSGLGVNAKTILQQLSSRK